MPSRFLHPTSPGGLLTNIPGLPTADEELVLQSIASGTYFYFNVTPSGAMNGSNPTFTLTVAPNPATSIELTLNGTFLSYGTAYTISGLTITMITNIPESGDELRASFTVSPV